MTCVYHINEEFPPEKKGEMAIQPCIPWIHSNFRKGWNASKTEFKSTERLQTSIYTATSF